MVFHRACSCMHAKCLLERIGVGVVGVGMRFTVKGREFDISREQILTVVKGKQPKTITKYYIEIEGIRYPIKQVIEWVTGLHPIEFTSMYANDILSKLGFEVKAS